MQIKIRWHTETGEHPASAVAAVRNGKNSTTSPEAVLGYKILHGWFGNENPVSFRKTGASSPKLTPFLCHN